MRVGSFDWHSLPASLRTAKAGLRSPNPACAWHPTIGARPHSQVWMDLVRQQWWTNTAGPKDAAGRYAVYGFYGGYEVTVPASGKSTSRRVMLSRGGVTLRVTLQ